MARTITQAIEQFLNNTIRLDPDENEVAKSSKSWLISQISNFPNDKTFPMLHPDVSIDFGSFSRKTKIRPLDDIDLMVIIHAQSNYRNDYSDRIEIVVHPNSINQKELCYDNSLILNSRKVINKFIEKLKDIPQYKKSEIKRNQEAATLNLSSYPWTFDIVPCFITAPLLDGSTFFLIPDGNGNWKKSDPRIDKNRIATIQRKHAVSIYDLVRLVKYWNSRRTMVSVSSYLLEVIVLNYYDINVSTNSLRVEFQRLLNYLANQIYAQVYDPKGFQGNLNALSFDDKKSVADRASLDNFKAIEANFFEGNNNHAACIGKWREIFGDNFPRYE